MRDDWGRGSRSPMSAGSFSRTAAGNRENPQITMTETRFYEPARLNTPPRPLSSLKPLDANLVEVIVIEGLPIIEPTVCHGGVAIGLLVFLSGGQ